MTFPRRLPAWTLAASALCLLLLPRLGHAQPGPNDPNWPALLSGMLYVPAPDADELTKLLDERAKAALAEAQARFREFQVGKKNTSALLETVRRLVNAEIELLDKPALQIILRERYLDLTREIEKQTRVAFDAGRIPTSELDKARYQRLDAEIQLLKAKRKAAAK